VLAGMLGVALGVGAGPAQAGYVTSLGIETTKPEDAERDGELLASKAVQDSLGHLRRYKALAQALKDQVEKNGDLVLIPTIRKEFDFMDLRNDLNVATTVFDETTQLTIDRASRAILYDLTELENASRLKKEESSRTPKKVANILKWFEKLDTDLGGYLAYFA